ncbi:class I SAM-dependent methyltransferase [Fructilactobacillus sp. Tb1]|uniref:class I SAM-dependent methyltransferase n=1 Tax=Fructilactobacillus sp. Tb1 TaxID=3422304 RepID=UPI003D2708C2
MREIEITGSAASKFEGGYPQISLKDFVNESDATDNGEFVALMKSGHFVASAYLAKQGNGIGWILSRKENQAINDNFFSRIFSVAFNKRNALQGVSSSSYRLFNGQGDGLGGITIDNYAGEIVISWENEGMYNQRRMLIPAIVDNLDAYSNVYEVKHYENGSTIQAIEGISPDPQEFKTIVEDGTVYPIHLEGASKTGLDLIYRDVRKQIKKNSQYKLVLNLLFDQTGFVSAAVTGGSTETEDVDQSKRAKSDLVGEFVANNIATDSQNVRSMDISGFLDYANKHNLRFDLITINLPTFLRSKKGNFNIRKDLTKLLTNVFTLANNEADVFVTTQTTSVNLRDFRSGVQKALVASKHKYMEKEGFKAPADYPFDREYTKQSPFKALWFKLQK